MILDSNSYYKAIDDGMCAPPALLTPLVHLSRDAVEKLRKAHVNRKTKSLIDNYDALKMRMPPSDFGKLRMAADFMIRSASKYFPAYHYFAGEYLNDEWLSSVDWHKGFHRDHVSHQVMSVFVTQKLLSRNSETAALFGGRPLIDCCMEALFISPETEYLRNYLYSLGRVSGYDVKTPLGRLNWEDLFRETATVAAMFHDCGYPWQFVSQVSNALSIHAPELSMPNAADSVLSAYQGRLFLYPLNGYQPMAPDQPSAWSERCRDALATGLAESHGLPGARTFTYLNDFLREYPRCSRVNIVQRFCIDWAAMAIMMHDLEPLYSGSKGNFKHRHLRVSLSRDPLSFVLTLVDQIQDFLRINAVFRSCHGKPTLNYYSACNSVKLLRDGHALVIQYNYPELSDYIQNKTLFKPSAEKAYFHPQSGYLNYSALPIDRIRLECVHGSNP